MNVWLIAMKEWKTARNVPMLIFMLATPVLLMLILGTVLSGNFNGSASVGDIRVLYSATGDETAREPWREWIGEASGSAAHGGKITFEESTADEAANIREVRNGSYAGYLSFGEEGIRYYGNERSGVENGIVQGVLAAYAENRKLALALPNAGEFNGTASHADRIKERMLQAPMQPGAIDYYAVAVTTMIIMYSAATAGLLFENERVRHTANRLLVAPVTKAEIFAGKIVGSLLLNLVFTIAIVLVSKYMYGANWGENPAMVLLVLVSQIVFAISLGLGIGYLFKGKAAGAVIMTIIQLAAFFGGSYYQIEDNGDFVSVLSRFSPLDWTNDALMAIIYGGSGAGGGLAAGMEAILLNAGLSVLFLAVSIWIMRRKEGL